MRQLQNDRKIFKFTIVELLVVVAIILILAALLFPVLNKVREKSKAIKCTSNLKQCGTASIAYAADYKGMIGIQQYPAPEGERTWLSFLIISGYLPTSRNEDENRYGSALKVGLCPSWAPFSYEQIKAKKDLIYWTYGVNRIDMPTSFLNDGATWDSRYLDLGKITSPSGYIHLADSTFNEKWGSDKTQCYYFSVSNDQYSLHMRHAKRLNAWFVDGHVGNCDRQQLKTNVLSFKPGATTVYAVIGTENMLPIGF